MKKNKILMFLFCQRVVHYLVIVLFITISGFSFGQSKKHKKKQELTAYDSLFLKSSFPEIRKLLQGTWRYERTECCNNLSEMKRYSFDDSSRVYIKHDKRFSLRNFYVVHYVGNDSIVKNLYLGLSDTVSNETATKRLEWSVKVINESYVKYLPKISNNISQKNFVGSFPGDSSIQFVKVPKYILEDSLSKSISYTFTLDKVSVKRDSAGVIISEASYPYFAESVVGFFGKERILISVKIGNNDEYHKLEGMKFYILEINDSYMRFVSESLPDQSRVIYNKE